MTGCRGNAMSLGAYFLEGRRVHQACKNPPKFRVFVNPPNANNDGTVLLCDHCNRFDYQAFRREPLPTRLAHRATIAAR